MVSEMVTNALRHVLPGPGDTGPRGPVRLGLLQQGPWVLCAVADPGKAAPVPRTPASLAEAWPRAADDLRVQRPVGLHHARQRGKSRVGHVHRTACTTFPGPGRPRPGSGNSTLTTGFRPPGAVRAPRASLADAAPRRASRLLACLPRASSTGGRAGRQGAGVVVDAMRRFRCRRRHYRDNAARTPACDRTSTGHVWIPIWRRYGRDLFRIFSQPSQPTASVLVTGGWRRQSLRARPLAPHRHPAYLHSSSTSLVHSLLAATKIRVCGQLAPGSRSLFLQPVAICLRAGGLFSAGVRRVVMLVVPPVWMGLR